MSKHDLWLQQPKQAWDTLKVVALDLTLPAGVTSKYIAIALQKH